MRTENEVKASLANGVNALVVIDADLEFAEANRKWAELAKYRRVRPILEIQQAILQWFLDKQPDEACVRKIMAAVEHRNEYDDYFRMGVLRWLLGEATQM